MRAIQTTAPGLQHVHLQAAPLPELRPFDVQIQVRAVSLNPVDHKLTMNGHPKWQYPHTLGVDGAGVVVGLGSEVQGIEVGTPVFYHADMTRPGTFAELATVDSRAVTVLPAGWTFQQGAALPCAGLTAYQALVRFCKVQAGQTVVIQGGAGGVGSFAVQIAHALGARVIATASRNKHQLVQSLGAGTVIDYHDADALQQIQEASNGGADIVLDTVSRASSTAGLKLLRPGGQLAFIAGRPDPEAVENLGHPVTVHDILLGGAHIRQDDRATRDLRTMGEELARMVNQGQVQILISTEISLPEIPEWLVRLRAGEVPYGKVVATL